MGGPSARGSPMAPIDINLHARHKDNGPMRAGRNTGQSRRPAAAANQLSGARARKPLAQPHAAIHHAQSDELGAT